MAPSPLDALRPDSDDFVALYQELVKHEICLMRLGDICENTQGYYTSRSGYPLRHDVDVGMSILDILYVLLVKEREIIEKYKPSLSDLEKFINKLLESRLLIDLPCSALSTDPSDIIQRILDNNRILEMGHLENPFMYYHMYTSLREASRGYGFDNKLDNLIKKYTDAKICFKTAYGELIRLYRYEAALPEQTHMKPPLTETPPYRVLEAYVLPFMEEPMPELKEEKLQDFCKKFSGGIGRYSQVVCQALTSIGVVSLHEYQYKMLTELFENFEKPKLVILSAPTASGKTEIFMTYLTAKLLAKGGVAVLIYPTKTLAREQLERFVRFLYSINKDPNGGRLVRVYLLDGDSPESSEEVKGKSFRGGIFISVGGRRGEIKYNEQGDVVIDWGDGNLERIEWLREAKDIVDIEEPAIIITNHSMLSTHLNKGSVWVRSLARLLNTIVIDEAHIFINDKERNDFLHFLLLRLLISAIIQQYGANSTLEEGLENEIVNLIKERGLDIVLSSATLSDREILPHDIATTQLGGIDLYNASQGSSDHQPAKLLLRWLYEIFGKNFKILYVPYYETIGDSKRKKLIVAAVYFPEPRMAARTPFNEALATTLIWTDAITRGLRRTYGVDYALHALAFLDSKATQMEVFKNIVGRGLKEEMFHADKLLVSPLIGGNSPGASAVVALAQRYQNDASSSIVDVARYSHLQLYYRWNTVDNYLRSLTNNAAGVNQSVMDALDFAKGVRGAAESGRSRYWIFHGNSYYVLVHNADIERDKRATIERILSGHGGHGWNLVISTSTLELGVNIPGVAVTLQFGAPPSSDSFIQRIGRSGRDNKTFRISFGAVFSRNFGRDILFIDETEAVRALFNLKMPKYTGQIDDILLVRYMALLYADLSNTSNQVDNIIKNVLLLYNKYNQIKLNELLDQIKMIYKYYIKLTEITREASNLYESHGPIPFTIIINRIAEKIESIKYRFGNDYLNIIHSLKSKSSSCILNALTTLKSIVESLPDDIRRPLFGFLPYSLELLDNIKKVNGDVEKLKVKLSKWKPQRIDEINIKNELMSFINDLSNVIDFVQEILLKTVYIFLGECKKKEDLVALLNGSLMPHRAIVGEINGCEFNCNSISLNDKAMYLNCKKVERDRRNILSNVPLKHYEVEEW
ncbi:MAG: DEAD/DEAH box helicase [Infirmifilum sp.]